MNAMIGAVCLALLAVVNLRVEGALTYPPVLFAAWWSLLLAALAASGDAFLPISTATLGIYILGACALSVGGFFAVFLYRRHPDPCPAGSRTWECRRHILSSSVILLAALFPALWQRIVQISAASGVRSFWVGVRLQTMQEGSSLGAFDYLIFFSTIVALAAFEDCRRRKTGRWLAAAAIVLCLAYHLVAASRLGALILIAGLVGVALLKGKHVVRPLVAGALAVVPVFATVALALNKSGDPGGSLSSNAIALTRSFQLYSLGGLVAFQNALDGSTAPESQGRTYRALYAVARASGRDVEVPQLVSQYAYTPAPTNVYTLYYPYFTDFGPIGVAMLMAFVGFLFSCIYLAATGGSWPFAAAYGIVFSYIVLSSADEYVFSLLSMNCQAAVYLLLLYKRSRTPENECSQPSMSLS